jgi:hypothetical protein
MTSYLTGAGRWLATAALLVAASCAGYKSTVATGDTEYSAPRTMVVTRPTANRSLEQVLRQAGVDSPWPQQGRLNKGSGEVVPGGGGSPALGGPTARFE